MVEPRYTEFEEEFDDTYIVTPERQIARPASKEKSTTNFTSFRAPKGSSPLKNPPINRTDFITPTVNDSLKENVPESLENLAPISNSPNSPPTSIRFNKRMSNDLEVPTSNKNQRIDRSSTGSSSPTKNRFMESLRKRLLGNSVQMKIPKTVVESSSPPRQAPVVQESIPLKVSEDNNDKHSQSIIDRVNSTLGELHRNDIPEQKHQSPKLPSSKNVSPKLQERKLLSKSPPNGYSDLPRDFVGQDLLGNSTPIHKVLKTVSSDSEQTELQAAWWPYLKWAKLKKIVMLKEITREEAISNKFLMNELECVNLAELTKRYDFLANFKTKRAKPDRIINSGRISKRSH